MPEALQDSLKYRLWAQALQDHGILIRDIEELYTVRKPRGEVLFSMVRLHEAGKPQLHATALLRGHYAAVLTVLVDKQTRAEKLLLVRQRRVANGAWFYDHPAGMLDLEEDPVKVAIREMEEETGLVIRPDQLHSLNNDPLYSSPGLLDEGGYFFWCTLEMEPTAIAALHGKGTGVADEQESIELFVTTLPEALRLIKNAQGVLHVYLYLDAKGKVSMG